MKFKLLIAALSFTPTMVLAQIAHPTPLPGVNGGAIAKPANPPAVAGAPVANSAGGSGAPNIAAKIQTTFLNPHLIAPGTVVKEVLRENSVGPSSEAPKQNFIKASLGKSIPLVSATQSPIGAGGTGGLVNGAGGNGGDAITPVPDSTIDASPKEKLKDIEGIPADQLRLVFNGKQLEK